MTQSAEIRLLGPLSVVAHGNEVALGGRKQQTLLALLALRAPREVSTDACVEVLWGDDVTDRSVHTLHTYVSNLRKLVADVDGLSIERTTDGYRLDVADDILDIDRFRIRVDAARRTDDPSTSADELRAALALWRGSALGDLGDEPWAQAVVQELDEARLAALGARIDADLALGRHRELVGELELLVADHPYREELWARLMLALYRSGRQADALAAFRRVQTLLGEELGIEPGRELAELEEQILLQDARLAPPDAPIPRHTPTPRSDLVGREELIEHLTGLVDAERIITLTGPGGVGKTSLATALAGRISDDERTVQFCDLVPVDDDGVAAAVAAAHGLHVEDPARATESVVRWLGHLPVLLILDNCEHVVDGVAAFVSQAVDRCAGLTVIATSREPLGVRGERIVAVPPLDVSAAVELLRRRAGDDVEDHRLAELCERLDGLPLALELAAARLSHLTVDEILDRLDQRLRLLAGGRRDNPRHAALETTIDWSYQLLTGPEQEMLRSVAVFVGGFDLTAAAAVWGGDEFEALDLIGSLVNKSLVAADRHGRLTRYHLLETVREFALARLDDTDERDTRLAAHGEHFLRRALSEPPHPPDIHPWQHLFELDLEPDVDLPNRVKALEWLIDRGRITDAALLHARMFALDHQRHVDRDRRVMERTDVAAQLPNQGEQALYLLASAMQANTLGRWESEYSFAVQALEVDADPHVSVIAAGLAAQAAMFLEPDRIDEFLARGQARLPVQSNNLATFLRERRSDALFAQGRTEETVAGLQELRRTGDAWAGIELCIGLHLVGRDDLIERHIAGLTDSERMSTFRYRIDLGRALAAIASTDAETAADHLARAGTEALRRPDELFDRDVLVGYAALALLEGDPTRASELLAVVGATTRTPASIVLYFKYRDLVRSLLTKDEIETIRRRMAGRDPGEVLAAEIERHRSPEP